MYRSLTLAEDQALKETVASRATTTSQHAWREILATDQRTPIPEITVTRAGLDEVFSLSDVADAIGRSLTNLLISRNEPEDSIFSDKNRSFVSSVAQRVSASLMQQVQRGGQLKLSQNDLYLLIEKALIENDAHDVAKSLVFQRSLERTGEITVTDEPHAMPVRLIRRNGNVVPWSETKIEQAVSRAFLTLKENPSAAQAIAHAVTALIRIGDQAFVHIEDVQDHVQDELMRQGHFKVAAHYVRYRDERARLRTSIEPWPGGLGNL
jgi:ribonucleoside-diphosphate reductase alpha chain